MNDDRVSQVLDFVAVSLKDNHGSLVFVVKRLFKRGHQRAELGTAAKLHSLSAHTQKSFAAPGLVDKRIKCVLQVTLVAREIDEQLDVVGNDGHLILRSKL